jgi:hypothetical protein
MVARVFRPWVRCEFPVRRGATPESVTSNSSRTPRFTDASLKGRTSLRDANAKTHANRGPCPRLPSFRRSATPEMAKLLAPGFHRPFAPRLQRDRRTGLKLRGASFGVLLHESGAVLNPPHFDSLRRDPIGSLGQDLREEQDGHGPRQQWHLILSILCILSKFWACPPTTLQ